ncbi:hypothetical protein HYFRA_00010252 [Hymenoscyphus fraxineus]|uniref:C2H2-type domain-containing protein n=1 Tax=Hymenoscyphus fraxineus TaxID=746836 RepID=A0A9N9KXX3_9HELO|nr:hypothetical protein HYFRA_00010252 [Hymenoscyphus fraxineus]
MTHRPSMHARDSSGKNVSLLNDDVAPPQPHNFSRISSYSPSDMSRSVSSYSTPSGTGSPVLPGLIRAESYDSQNTTETQSPLTPHSELGTHSSYTGESTYKDPSNMEYRDRSHSFHDYPSNYHGISPRTQHTENRMHSYSQPQVYDEEAYHNGNISERGAKRYNCRYRDTLGCEKTFTTSGHASRHSKIHTAEKAVPCTFAGCQKKFTRNDNMKQHLETHNKDRSRSNSTRAGGKPPVLTVSAGIKKVGRATSRPTTPGLMVANAEISPIIDPALFSTASNQTPVVLPTGSLPNNPHGFRPSLVARPMDSKNGPPNSCKGLDALAMAVQLAQSTL